MPCVFCKAKPDIVFAGVKADGSKGWGYVPHPNEGVGLECKRLLDLARIHYLRQNGMRTELVNYVDRDTSLENVLLLAWPDAADTGETCDTGGTGDADASDSGDAGDTCDTGDTGDTEDMDGTIDTRVCGRDGSNDTGDHNTGDHR